MKKTAKKLQSGFTLIELLVVITVISALAVTVFVALNPAQRLKDARQSRRQVDVDTILSAIHSSIVDNKGTLPTNLPTTEAMIGTATTGCDTIGSTVSSSCTPAAACKNLLAGSQNLTNYLGSQPIDPLGGTFDLTKTGYDVVYNSTTGIVTVKACGQGAGTAEDTTNISESR